VIFLIMFGFRLLIWPALYLMWLFRFQQGCVDPRRSDRIGPADTAGMEEHAQAAMAEVTEFLCRNCWLAPQGLDLETRD
jgi:hypothetical protein